ncbi:hypothetical protein TWF225_003074 [Orbilia oligospora]|nr:hypothetical protein TWF225_003074 [Orbilia oligospora]
MVTSYKLPESFLSKNVKLLADLDKNTPVFKVTDVTSQDPVEDETTNKKTDEASSYPPPTPPDSNICICAKISGQIIWNLIFDDLDKFGLEFYNQHKTEREKRTEKKRRIEEENRERAEREAAQKAEEEAKEAVRVAEAKTEGDERAEATEGNKIDGQSSNADSKGEENETSNPDEDENNEEENTEDEDEGDGKPDAENGHFAEFYFGTPKPNGEYGNKQMSQRNKRALDALLDTPVPNAIGTDPIGTKNNVTANSRSFYFRANKKPGIDEMSYLPDSITNQKGWEMAEGSLNRKTDIRALKKTLYSRYSYLVDEGVIGGEVEWDLKGMENADSIMSRQCPITYDDVIMDPVTKATVKQFVALSKLKVNKNSSPLFSYFKSPGILLFGPPGTGKTHLCRAIANDSGHTFIALSAAELNGRYVGETEKVISAMFNLARKLHPCILFLDEEMDGIAAENGSNKAPLVVVATNRPGDLDEAFLRRLPYHVFLTMPSYEERRRILERMVPAENLAEDVNLADIAKRAEGYSGSDLRTLCGQAALAWATELEVSTGEAFDGQEVKLNMKNFELAFSRTGPSASPELIESLEKFHTISTVVFLSGVLYSHSLAKA